MEETSLKKKKKKKLLKTETNIEAVLLSSEKALENLGIKTPETNQKNKTPRTLFYIF